MELYSISMQAAPKNHVEQLYMRLSCALKALHHKAFNIFIHKKEGDHQTNQTDLVCEVTLPGFQLQIHSHEVYAATANALAEYIIDEMETKLIHRMVVKKLGSQNNEEIVKIESYCGDILKGHSVEHSIADGRQQRVLKVAKVCHDFLEQHSYLVLEGFVRFRLKAYVDELQEIVEYAIDESIMEKQYQEFIALLKYFVYIQESKIPVAHLMHQGGQEFLVLNEEMKQIEFEQDDGLVVEMIDKDMNVEDMIVSTLISVSPQHVYIHTREPETQIIKTIQQIFEDRTHICIDCELCAPVLDKNQENNQLYP